MLLFTVFLLASASIKDVYSVMPVDLNFYAEEGNWLINATLTGKDSAKQIKIDEYIQSTNGTINGKIVVKIDNNAPIIVYYRSSNKYERLIVRETRCLYMEYGQDGWNYYMGDLGADNFATHLILVGPSVLFRINKFNPVWKPGQDDIIRGIKQHCAGAVLDRNLDVWFYYKGQSLEGLKRPSRILFSGCDPRHNNNAVEQFWFDYYVISKVQKNFDTIVTPEPGIVCDKYFQETSTSALTPLPKFDQHRVHFIAKTKSFKAGPDRKEEVYADERFQTMRIKISTPDKDKNIITTDMLYDYQLGIAYKFTEDGKCLVSPMDSSERGIVRDSSLNYGNYKLDLAKLLKLDQPFRYLGPVLFEDRDEIGIQAWERYDKSFRFGDKNFPNVVTTQYICGATDEQNGFKLVGTTFKAYDNSQSKKMIGSLAKSYFDFNHEISSSDSMEKFSVKDCYPDPKDKKTIAFYFTCSDTRCDNFNQYYHQIQDKIAEALINTRTISASRISNIVPIIDSEEIVVYVTLLNFPNITDAFKMKTMKLANKVLTTTTRVKVDGDEEDCLRTNAYKYEPFISIAFCKTEEGNVCIRIDGNKVKLVEDKNNGTTCSVFMTPLKNVYRYSREYPLDNIHMRLNNIEITLNSVDNNKAFKLTSHQVTDVTKSVDENNYNSIYEKIIPNTKLIGDKLDIAQIVGNIDLSSCHRKCVQSVDNDCRSFSFCTYPDRTECFLSTIGNVSFQIMSNNSACGTYFIDNLVKFKKISFKKFNYIEVVPFESSLGKCASFCSNTDSCKSFQYCSGSCSLAGYYTDASTAYSEICDIYIPNVLNRFELTGKLVTENVFYTELNLNAEQCAALCHDWKDNDSVCQSFNFCPAHGKTSSLCHLSKYSTRNANEKLVRSDSCQNYERTEKRVKEQKSTRPNTKPLLNFGPFGSYWIIFLFVVTGLGSGIIVSVVYSKLFTNRSEATEIYNRHTFSWTKQLNDERQSVAHSEVLQMSSDYAVPASE